MVEHELNRSDGILTIRPHGRLEATDFERIATEIDPYIEANGRLNGIMIQAESFPGWKDFGGLIAHLRFVKNHHQNIEKIAAVSDSAILTIAPAIAKHFVHAEVRHFPQADKDAALAWLRTSN